MPTPHLRQTVQTLLVVAPGLLALPDAVLERSTPLARLAAFAPDPGAEPAGIDAATAAVVGFRGATAPLAALGAGVDVAGEWVLHADPVHVQIGASNAVVTGRVDDLDADETGALVADIDKLVELESVHIVAASPDRWFALAAHDIAGAAVPVEAVIGRDLIDELRRNDVARTLVRIRSEVEMLLHDHPVNRARAARGATTVDALWFWGGGRLPVAGDATPVVAASAPPGRIGDLVAGIARVRRARVIHRSASSQGLGALFAAMDDASARRVESAPASPGVVLAAAGRIDDEAGALDFARGWLAPSLVRLEAHTIGEFVLVADGSGFAATWRARAPGIAARLRARLGGPRFEPPHVDRA